MCDNIPDKGLSTSVEQLSVHGSESQGAESMVQPQNPDVFNTYSSKGIHNCASGWLIVLGFVQILVGVYYTLLFFVPLPIIAIIAIIAINIASGSVAIAGGCTKKEGHFKATLVLSIVSIVPAIGLTYFSIDGFNMFYPPSQPLLNGVGPLIIFFGLLPALTTLITATISAILACKLLAGRNQPIEDVIPVPLPTDDQEQGVQLYQGLPATERKPDIPANEVEKRYLGALDFNKF